MEDIYISIKYENDWFKRIFDNKDFISLEEIRNKIEELYDEKNHIEEEFNDFKQDVEDNYRPLKYEEQI